MSISNQQMIFILISHLDENYAFQIFVFGQIWIGVAQFAQSAKSGLIRRVSFHEESEGMPWERLFQDFEQDIPFNDLSLPRKSPGQRPGFSSSIM